MTQISQELRELEEVLPSALYKGRAVLAWMKAIEVRLSHLEAQTDRPATATETTGCNCVTMDSRYRTEDRGPHHWDTCPMYRPASPETETARSNIGPCAPWEHRLSPSWQAGDAFKCTFCDFWVKVQIVPAPSTAQKG